MGIYGMIAAHEARQRELKAKQEAELKAAEAGRLAKQAMELTKENSNDIEMIKKELGSINEFIIGMDSKITTLEGNFDSAVDQVRKDVLKLGGEFKEFKKEIKDTVSKVNTAVGREISKIKSEILNSKNELQKLIEGKASKQEIQDKIDELNSKISGFEQKSEQIINSKIDVLKQELKDENEVLYSQISGVDGLITKATEALKESFGEDLKNAKSELAKLISDLGERVNFVEASAKTLKSEIESVKSEFVKSEQDMKKAISDLSNDIKSVAGSSSAAVSDLEKKLVKQIESSFKDKFSKLAKMLSGEMAADDAELVALVSELKKDSLKISQELKLQIEAVKEEQKKLLTSDEFETLTKKLENFELKFQEAQSANDLTLKNIQAEIVGMTSEIALLNNKMVGFESEIISAKETLEKEVKKITDVKTDLDAFKKLSSEGLTKAIESYEKLVAQKNSDSSNIDAARAEIEKQMQLAKAEFESKLKLSIEKIENDLKSKLSGAELEVALKGLKEAQAKFQTQVDKVQLDLESVKQDAILQKQEFEKLNSTVSTAKQIAKEEIEQLTKQLAEVKSDFGSLKTNLDKEVENLSVKLEDKISKFMSSLNEKSSNTDIEVIKEAIKTEVEASKQIISEEIANKLMSAQSEISSDQAAKLKAITTDFNLKLATIDNQYKHLINKLEEVKLLQVKTDDVEVSKIVDQAKVVDAMSDLVMKALLNENDIRQKQIVSEQLKQFEKVFVENLEKIASTDEEKLLLSNAKEKLALFIDQVKNSRADHYKKEIVKNIIKLVEDADSIMIKKIQSAEGESSASESAKGLLSEAKKMLTNDLNLAKKEKLAVLTYKLSNDIAASIQNKLPVQTKFIQDQVTELNTVIKELEGTYNKGSTVMNDLINIEDALKNVTSDLNRTDVDYKKLISDLMVLNSAEVKYFEDIQDSGKDFAAQEFQYLWLFDGEMLESMNLALAGVVKTIPTDQA